MPVIKSLFRSFANDRPIISGCFFIIVAAIAKFATTRTLFSPINSITANMTPNLTQMRIDHFALQTQLPTHSTDTPTHGPLLPTLPTITKLTRLTNRHIQMNNIDRRLPTPPTLTKTFLNRHVMLYTDSVFADRTDVFLGFEGGVVGGELG